LNNYRETSTLSVVGLRHFFLFVFVGRTPEEARRPFLKEEAELLLRTDPWMGRQAGVAVPSSPKAPGDSFLCARQKTS